MVIPFAAPASSDASDNGTDLFSEGFTASATSAGLDVTRKPAARTALLRNPHAAALPCHEERWEAEVARGIGSNSVGRSEAFSSRGGRNAARLGMKSTGSRLAELCTTNGSGISQDDLLEAEKRAQERRMDQKKEALAAAAVKAQERVAKMTAKRTKAKQTQLRQELRIHEAADKKAKMEEQKQHDKDVLHDIVKRRREAQQRIAEHAAQDDSLEKILQWALPEAKTAREALTILGDQVGNDNTALKLMAKELGEDGDDNAVLELMQSRLGNGDNDTVRKLMDRGLGNGVDDDTVRKLMTKGLETVNDDDAVLKLMTKGGEKVDDDTVRKLMSKEGDKDKHDDTVLRLLAKGNGKISDDDTMFTLMGKATAADNSTMQRLMAKSNLAKASLEDTNAMLRNLGKETLVRPLPKQIDGAVKDDEAFQRILGTAPNRAEARANATALRFILGGTTDPVTRMAQLARNRPKAGTCKETADNVQAVRDLQVLNEMLEKSELDVDIQAWKDVGAIHMLMQDLSGPDPEMRKRFNQLQTDDDAVAALMKMLPSQQGVDPGPQAAADMQAVQRLLGQPPRNNLLQPPSFSSSGALERLIGQSQAPRDSLADSKIIQNLMSPHGTISPQLPPTSNAGDANIITQLMSPRSAATARAVQSQQGVLGGYPSTGQALMTMMGSGAATTSREQDNRDVDALRRLLL